MAVRGAARTAFRPRESGSARLDEERQRRSALCVVGPPGAGKTTLVAGWLDAARGDGIWYQVDPGDADLATFFYYLRLAATAFARKGQQPLPLLTPEYLPDIDGFARRFFRDLFARLPDGASLVLDNYQEVPADSQFHRVVALSIDEIPPGITLIAVSRRDPPDCYARLIANEHVSFIQWEELRLSPEEAYAISTKRTTLSRQQFDTLYRASDGWAAGLTLMLERVKRNGMVPEAVGAETREAVFNYFAGVIFDRLPADTQHACLTTALLPQVTARGAELVSGQPEAAGLLEQLYRGRLFTDRRMVVAAGQGAYPGSDGLVATYQYHPLFRAFLLERGRQAWSPEVRQRWSLNAASLLEVSGQTLDAIAILVELAQWTRAAELIVAQAPKLIAQGRWQTLHAWLQGLPEAVLEQEPWLVYWWGISLLAVNQDDARKLLERAHRLMQAAGDAGGQLQAAAGVIDSHYYQWASFAEVDRWIVVIQALLEAKPVFDSVEAELHVYSSLLIAIAYREPANPMLPDCVARVAQLLDTDADVAQRVTAGTCLLGYCYFAGEYGLAQRAIATIEPLLAHADVTSLNRLWWRARVAHYAYNIADYPGALRALDEAVDISRNHGSAGLHSVEPLLAFFNALVALSSRDLAGARECVATLRRLANPRRRFDMWYLQFIESVMALLANDLSESLDLARTSIQSAVAIGMVYLHELSLTLTAHVLAQMGRYDDALQAAADAKALVEGSVNRNMAAEAIFVEAHVAAQQGNPAKATALVQSAFRTSRDAHYLFWFRFMPTVLPEACSLALSMGIDCEYVTGVIHRYGIAPPRPYVKDWPWPLRISTLGPFSIVKAGGPLDLARTGTRKPMELLKAIIALGIEGVPVAALIDQLWPDAEGDAGHKALAITLHRLRKQLGDERAVVLKGGSVAIDQRLCWVDVSAFERIAREEVTFEDRARAAAAAADLEALYRGSFLSAELSQQWILVPRQRLHTRFLAIVARLGEALEGHGDLERAAALYRHALDIDNCAEPIYRRLMRRCQKSGAISELDEIYRRCCDALKAAGVARPSVETEALYRSIAAASLR